MPVAPILDRVDHPSSRPRKPGPGIFREFPSLRIPRVFASGTKFGIRERLVCRDMDALSPLRALLHRVAPKEYPFDAFGQRQIGNDGQENEAIVGQGRDDQSQSLSRWSPG